MSCFDMKDGCTIVAKPSSKSRRWSRTHTSNRPRMAGVCDLEMDKFLDYSFLSMTIAESKYGPVNMGSNLPLECNLPNPLDFPQFLNTIAQLHRAIKHI